MIISTSFDNRTVVRNVCFYSTTFPTFFFRLIFYTKYVIKVDSFLHKTVYLYFSTIVRNLVHCLGYQNHVQTKSEYVSIYVYKLHPSSISQVCGRQTPRRQGIQGSQEPVKETYLESLPSSHTRQCLLKISGLSLPTWVNVGLPVQFRPILFIRSRHGSSVLLKSGCIWRDENRFHLVKSI